MNWTHRPYHGEADFLALLALLSACNAADPSAGYIQPGDLSWWIRQNEVFKPQDSIEIFEDSAGQMLGFVFSDPPTWAVVQALPGVPGSLLDDMLGHARGRAGNAELTVWAFEGDGALIAALKRHSFTRTDRRTVQFEYCPADQGIPDAPRLPAGFSLTAIPDDHQLKTRRVELHQAVWHPSQVTAAAYDHLRASPAYDSELDVALVGPGGQLVAYALGWFDPRTRIGVMEPVGTHPGHRGQGLGRLTVREVNRRLAECGAERIIIRTPESNAGAVRLYASANFRITGYVCDYSR
ncbi:GNAT family N-acetyltransferase [Deinococcus frigens]|uniref:GNAT family N-acetyltransferase n=1 Tax=Deinococcus frigens TaxID=249403 RepID=UPI00068DD13E|nr:GNAT family N-acetyltransferase [Deinococcus frigens]